MENLSPFMCLYENVSSVAHKTKTEDGALCRPAIEAAWLSCHDVLSGCFPRGLGIGFPSTCLPLPIHTYIYIYNARLYILLVAQVVDEDAQSSGYHFVTNLISVINFLSTMQLAQCAHLVYFSDLCVCARVSPLLGVTTTSGADLNMFNAGLLVFLSSGIQTLPR